MYAWDVGYGVDISDEQEDKAFIFAKLVTDYTGIKVCTVTTHTDIAFRFVDGVDFKLNGALTHWSPERYESGKFYAYGKFHVLRGNHAGEVIEDHNGIEPNARDVTYVGRTYASGVIEWGAIYDMIRKEASIDVGGSSKDFDMSKIRYSKTAIPF